MRLHLYKVWYRLPKQQLDFKYVEAGSKKDAEYVMHEEQEKAIIVRVVPVKLK